MYLKIAFDKIYFESFQRYLFNIKKYITAAKGQFRKKRKKRFDNDNPHIQSLHINNIR